MKHFGEQASWFYIRRDELKKHSPYNTYEYAKQAAMVDGKTLNEPTEYLILKMEGIIKPKPIEYKEKRFR